MRACARRVAADARRAHAQGVPRAHRLRRTPFAPFAGPPASPRGSWPPASRSTRVHLLQPLVSPTLTTLAQCQPPTLARCSNQAVAAGRTWRGVTGRASPEHGPRAATRSGRCRCSACWGRGRGSRPAAQGSRPAAPPPRRRQRTGGQASPANRLHTPSPPRPAPPRLALTAVCSALTRRPSPRICSPWQTSRKDVATTIVQASTKSIAARAVDEASDWTKLRRQEAQHDSRRRAAADVALAIDGLASKLSYRQVRVSACARRGEAPLPRAFAARDTACTLSLPSVLPLTVCCAAFCCRARCWRFGEGRRFTRNFGTMAWTAFLISSQPGKREKHRRQQWKLYT